VKSVRGPGGGYRLSRAADELRVADIILAVDEPIRATRCLPGSAKGCTGTTMRCVAHDLWEELGQQIHVFLSSISLADVVERRVLGRARSCRPATADSSDETRVAA
jgi:Rrf2 family iron-sulfur cluster assembly transcriptional regulator